LIAVGDERLCSILIISMIARHQLRVPIEHAAGAFSRHGTSRLDGIGTIVFAPLEETLVIEGAESTQPEVDRGRVRTLGGSGKSRGYGSSPRPPIAPTSVANRAHWTPNCLPFSIREMTA
jgi:hypothetical protein